MMEGFRTYPKIKRLGDEENKHIFDNPQDLIVIQEKIDGGNFRFTILNDGKVIIGSRTQQLTDDEGQDANMAKDFKRCSDYIRHRLSNLSKEVIDIASGYIFFGEACHKHTINYDWDKIPPFLGFDIYDMNQEEFLDYARAEEIYKQLCLPMVPLVDIKPAKDIGEINDDMVPMTAYPSQFEVVKDKKAEGLVFKNYSKQVFAKYVRDAFKEKNAEMFGGNPKYNKVDDTDNDEFVFKYVTNTRIEKLIFKHLDDGDKLEMPLIGKIIKETYLDIIEEEWKEILTSNWKLDFKGIRKKIAHRCRAVLERVIINNALHSDE